MTEEYHAGIVLRTYPDTKTKEFIKRNSDLSRFIYNKLIALNRDRQPFFKKMSQYFLQRDLLENLHKTDKQIQKIMNNKNHNAWYLRKMKEKFWKHRNKIFKINDQKIKNIIDELNLRIDRLNKIIKIYDDQLYNPKNITDQLLWYDKKLYDSLTKVQAQNHYKAAWNSYSKVHNAGVPKFKKKSYNENYSTYLNKNCKVEMRRLGYYIKIPKIGFIRISGIKKGSSQRKLLFKKVRDHEIFVKTVTIKKDLSDRYFVSLQLSSNDPVFERYPKTGSKLGIDLNLDNFMTDSNGNVVDNPRYYHNNEKQLIKTQRIMSRTYRHFDKRYVPKKGKHKRFELEKAKNYQKARHDFNKVHDHIARSRHEFLNDLSTKIVKSHDIIVLEELRSKNLLKNHALAKSISDVGWRTFIGMLQYKADVHGKQVILINPRFTTQICNDCGFRMGTEGTKKLKLSDRKWICPRCGSFHIRDHNAAKNILAKGLVILS